MNTWMWIIGCLLLICLIPGTLELYFISISAWFYTQKKTEKPFENQTQTRLAIIVPAHNEEKQIVQTVLALKKCEGQFALYVIADNCSDQTANLARQAGAEVLVRDDLENPGKPKALQFAFDQLIDQFDGFLIVDAESKPSKNLAAVVQQAFNSGSRALQVGNHLEAMPDTPINRLKRLAFFAHNTLRPMARSVFNLSCGVLGNGFGLTSALLKKIPMISTSLVEDAEYNLQLVLNGEKVLFFPECSVVTETASGQKAACTQSSRWEGGRFRLIQDFFGILAKGIINGNFYCLEPLCEILLLPLGWHVLLLGVALILFQGTPLLLLIALFAPLFYLVTALVLMPAVKQDFAALFFLPVYLFRKLLTLPSIFKNIKNGSKWERTDRH